MSDRIYSNDPDYASDNIVLVAQSANANKLLTKRNSPAGQRSYDNVYKYNFHEVRIDSLDELYCLSKRMLEKPRCCFVRARVKDLNNRFNVRRLYKDEDATLVLQNFNWLALDIDWKTQPSSGDLISDTKDVLLALPSCFLGVECFVVASSSYGLRLGNKPPTIRMRMFFWSRQTVSNTDLKRCLSGYEKICDLAMFDPIQLIYTAKPIFTDMLDPVPNRIEWITPLGMFSNYVEIQPAYQHYKGSPEIWYTRRAAEAFRNKYLILIANLSTGERRPGLIKFGYFMGKLVGQGHYDRDEMIEWMIDACDEWTDTHDPKKDREAITYGVDGGIDSMYKGETQ